MAEHPFAELDGRLDTWQKVRRFVAAEFAKLHLVVTESCHVVTSTTSSIQVKRGSWNLSFAVKHNEEIRKVLSKPEYSFSATLVYGDGLEASFCGYGIHGVSQEQLWMVSLISEVSKGHVNKIRVTEETLAADGVIERRVSERWLFGCDVSGCESWGEVLMRRAIAGV